jgi:hypothetical protein
LELSEENARDQQILTSYAYSTLRKRKILKAFGYVETTPRSLPFKAICLMVSM